MRCLNVLFILSIALVNELQINNKSSFKSASQLYTQAINNCPREFTGWVLIKSFETKSYTLALCQKGDFVYLVGHEKQQHEAFITASVISQNDDLIIAQDNYGFSFEISDRELKVTKNERLIAQEKIFNLYIKQDENNSESNLTSVVWQLQQIRYNNDELIEVDNPSNYTIEFLPDGQVQIKADCNRARGTYTQKGSSISIKIGPTTRAMCPPESISERYLKELQSAVIFFFQDGNLYFDLKFDTGTMKFIPDN
ncbi:MAG: META domain-containing protein [Xenococcaceae cyanobacterium MO_167.B27]|nr:META domain-containing protein [Xenococcaceae cyanobacterium MO_167.B27]